MRALIRIGEPKKLWLNNEYPELTAEAHPECYLIRSKAAALTRQELTWPEPLTGHPPIPALDLAGVVISAPLSPPSSSQPIFAPGTPVFALTTHTWQGNARDLTIASTSELARAPSNLSWEEIASVPLSALSAYQGLFVHGELKSAKNGAAANEGKRVLVTAASGGVGIWAVQLAREARCTIVGTCSDANVDFVKGLGAHEVLDYKTTDVLDWVNVDRKSRAFDVVLDCIGGDTLTQVWKCAREGGKVVSVAEPPEPKRPAEGVANGVKGVWFIVVPSATQLAEVTELLEGERARATLDSVFELEDFEAAFRRVESGRARGKVVLKLEE